VKIYATDKITNKKDSLRVKSNLSKNGKIYTRPPTVKHVGDRIFNHIHTQALLQQWVDNNPQRRSIWDFPHGRKCANCLESDWQIEKFENNEWIAVK